MSVHGLRLPFSTSSKSALVAPAPWYFGGRLIEVRYRTDSALFRSLLPHPLEIDELGPVVSVVFAEMSSISSAEDSFERPGRSNYCEFLIKLHVRLGNKTYWYVPGAWVDKDFSLVRGLYLGIEKKFGLICLSSEHDLNPLLGTLRPGSKVGATCEGPDEFAAKVVLELSDKVEARDLAQPLVAVVEDLDSQRRGLQRHVVEFIASEYREANIWAGRADLLMRASLYDDISQLGVVDMMKSYYFKQGFVLHGVRIIETVGCNGS